MITVFALLLIIITEQFRTSEFNKSSRSYEIYKGQPGRSAQDQRRIISMVMTSVVSIIVPVFGAWLFFLANPQAATALSPGAAEINPLSRTSVTFDRPNGFYAAYINVYGFKHLVPSNDAVYISIVNHYNYPVQFREVFLEYRASPFHWVPLTRIHVSSLNRLIAYGISTLGTLQICSKSDDFEFNTQNPIKAHAVVSGWVLFDYPSNNDAAHHAPKRLTVLDSEGNAIRGNIVKHDVSSAELKLAQNPTGSFENWNEAEVEWERTAQVEHTIEEAGTTRFFNQKRR